MRAILTLVCASSLLVMAGGRAHAQESVTPEEEQESVTPEEETGAPVEGVSAPVEATIVPVEDTPMGSAAALETRPASAGPTPPIKAMMGVPRLRTTTWNIELEGAVRMVQSDGLETFPLMGRLELGVLVAREPWLFAVSLTGELGGLGSRGIGGQFEVTHLWGGYWGHLGVSWVRDDIAGNTAVMSTAIGFTLLGVEWQRQLDSAGSLGDGFFLGLRLPLGSIYTLLYGKRT